MAELEARSGLAVADDLARQAADAALREAIGRGLDDLSGPEIDALEVLTRSTPHPTPDQIREIVDRVGRLPSAAALAAMTPEEVCAAYAELTAGPPDPELEGLDERELMRRYRKQLDGR